MRLDKSVENFSSNPDQYLLKVETTKDNQKIIKAEKKGIITWIKAHLPSFFFGDYNLKNVVALMSDANMQLKRSVDKVIQKYNSIHPKTEIAYLTPTAGKSPQPADRGTPAEFDMQSQVSSFEPPLAANSELTANIIEAAGDKYIEKDGPNGQEVNYVREICKGDFVKNPTAHIINKMIERGVGRAIHGDSARAFIMSQIPGFIEKASSPNYLRAFAEQYFQNNPLKPQIMEIFENSLSSELFNETLNTAVESFKRAKNEKNQEKTCYGYAENELRLPMTIFRQAAELKEFTIPASFYLE